MGWRVSVTLGVIALLGIGCGGGGPTVALTPSADSAAQKEVIQLSVHTQPTTTGEVKFQSTAGQFDTTSQSSATLQLSGGDATINWSCDAKKDSHCAGHVGFTATVNGSSGYALVNVALPQSPDGGADAGSSNGP